jgi:hypothetical protein
VGTESEPKKEAPKKVEPKVEPKKEAPKKEEPKAEPVVRNTEYEGMTVKQLEQLRRKLNSEIYALEQTPSELSVFLETGEDESQSVQDEDRQSTISDKRSRLRGVAEEIALRNAENATRDDESKAEAKPLEADPVFDPLPGPVFPKRDLRRADERVVEAETQEYYMPGGTSSQFVAGTTLRPTTVMSKADPDAPPTETRYSRSRKRAGLKRAFGLEDAPIAPMRSFLKEAAGGIPYEGAIRPAYALAALGATGAEAAARANITAYRDPETGELKRMFTGKPIDVPVYDTELARTETPQGGILTAPRPPSADNPYLKARGQQPTQLSVADVNLRLERERVRLSNLQEQLDRLREDSARQRRNPEPYNARIAQVQSAIEQKEANIDQLERVKRTTIPRERYETERAETADRLMDEFATEF